MKKLVPVGVILTVALLISACAGPSRLEADFGKSVRLSRLNQISDPEAERNLETVVGLDGRAALIGMERYRKAFEQTVEAPQVTFQIGTVNK